MERLRVLLIADACNPRVPSMPTVGYHIVRALAKRPDLKVTLVTQIRNKHVLDGDSIQDGAEVSYIDSEFIARPLKLFADWLRGDTGLAWTIGAVMYAPSYLALERLIYKQYRERFRRGDYSLIHRVTPITPTVGSPLASLTDVPMLIGPLNGGLPWPKEYPELRHQEREWITRFRSFYKPGFPR